MVVEMIVGCISLLIAGFYIGLNLGYWFGIYDDNKKKGKK